jgi:shikimate dehydrogenase
MKKYLVIGNPIEHSLSPKLHNYWFEKNNIDANYDRRKIDKSEIEETINEIKSNKLDGINVTVPFKNDVIPFLDMLSKESQITHNTDIKGFELSLKETKFNLENKTIFILGAGGVVPSIIYALEKLGVSKIIASNRTKQKTEDLKKKFSNISVVDWGDQPEFDIIINATSLGLDKNDNIGLNLRNINKEKLFYDVIYNPKETNFLRTGKKLGCQVSNGKMMFIYQAFEAFKLWHKVKPEINEELKKFLDL